MPRTTPLLPIEVRRALGKLGPDLKDARLRRRLPMAVVAERAQISRRTLLRVERGEAGVSMGVYATVLWVLGLGGRVGRLAAAETDTIGLRLEAVHLPKRVRLPRPQAHESPPESA
jgi:transcriptional regulator with XRE-family HTH domain